MNTDQPMLAKCTAMCANPSAAQNWMTSLEKSECQQCVSTRIRRLNLERQLTRRIGQTADPPRIRPARRQEGVTVGSVFRLVNDKDFLGGRNHFPGSHKAARDNERLTLRHRHRGAQVVRDDARAFQNVAVLFFRVDDPPLPDLTAPDSRHELLAGIRVMHPDGLLWISFNQFLGRKKIRIGDCIGFGELEDWHANILLSPDAPDALDGQMRDKVQALRRTRECKHPDPLLA